MCPSLTVIVEDIDGAKIHIATYIVMLQKKISICYRKLRPDVGQNVESVFITWSSLQDYLSQISSSNGKKIFVVGDFNLPGFVGTIRSTVPQFFPSLLFLNATI